MLTALLAGYLRCAQALSLSGHDIQTDARLLHVRLEKLALLLGAPLPYVAARSSFLAPPRSTRRRWR